MLDLKDLRANPDTYISALKRRGVPREKVQKILELDHVARQQMQQAQEIKAEINRISKQIAEVIKNGDESSAETLRQQSKELGTRYVKLNQESQSVLQELDLQLKLLPNLPAPECPDGISENNNIILKHYQPINFQGYEPYQKIPHFEVGKALGILDLERGAKLSGSMFVVFKKAGAKLQRALTNWALDLHESEFEEIKPPTLVKRETMVSTGHLPKFADEAYQIEKDDLWAIPTAEVPLTSLHKDEILPKDDLPKLMTAVTACFRREAGAYGKDTRGLLRVHEFEKVEILAYCLPEQAGEIHLKLLSQAELLLQELNLEYRVVDLCAGDLGNSSRRTFDLQTYAPGINQWLEVSSVSWFGDYQARRANIRYKDSNGKLYFINTLNGSALAWPRVIATLLEVGRQPDGSVILPEVLSKYLNGKIKINLRGELEIP
jgi:seryl-tRNA synthetase